MCRLSPPRTPGDHSPSIQQSGRNTPASMGDPTAPGKSATRTKLPVEPCSVAVRAGGPETAFWEVAINPTRPEGIAGDHSGGALILAPVKKGKPRGHGVENAAPWMHGVVSGSTAGLRCSMGGFAAGLRRVVLVQCRRTRSHNALIVVSGGSRRPSTAGTPSSSSDLPA